MTVSRRRPVVAALASLTLLAAAACGSDEDSSESDSTSPATSEASDPPSTDEAAEDASDDGAEAASGDQPAQADEAERPTIVVTTNILSDVVGEVVGDDADVITIMPVGADPHDFQASAQEVDQMVSADALIVNGADFEEGLLDVIENARGDGVPTYEAIEAVETIEFGEGGHDHDEHGDEKHSDEKHGDEDHGDEDHGDEDHGDEDHGDEDHGDEDHGDEEHGDEDHGDEDHGDEDHGDEDHGDEEHGDEDHGDEDHGDDDGHDHGHDHEGVDPHFFTDPMRMAAAVDGIVGFLAAEVSGLDAEELEAAAAAYVAELESLDADVVSLVDAVPVEGRVLVTNHDAFGYFADSYGFEIVGVVIPGGSTTDAVSAGEFAELAEVIEAEGVPAIFSETTASDELITVLADEVGDVDVVELYSGSLGEPGSDGDTYLKMVRTNAERISAALA